MIGINKKEILILNGLSVYGFLSYEQMIHLGIAKHKSNLASSLSKLSAGKAPRISKIPHEMGGKAIYYLRKTGKLTLEKCIHTRLQQAKYSIRKIERDTQDKLHRTFTIDVHISIIQSLRERSVLFCHRYFDKQYQNNSTKKIISSRIKTNDRSSIIPDILLKLKSEAQEELYLIEIENGTNAHKTIAKCVTYAYAQLNGTLNQSLNFNSGIRTLWILEHNTTLNKVLDKLEENELFKNLTEYFLFKSIDQINDQDFLKDWINISRKKRSLYYI